MKIHLWGTDFRRSSAEMRKKLSIPLPERVGKLRDLIGLGFQDVVYLWTCNRVEFYTTAQDYFSDTRPLWLTILKQFGLTEDDYYRGYHFEGKSALRHLMRVASSLESMVVGEPQILGQLKGALSFNKENGLPLDKHLEQCFHLSFETAKRVRTETAIAEKPVSVASLGLKYLASMEKEYPLEKAVVVGRSPISLMVLQWLKKNRSQCPVVWVNRSIDVLKSYPEYQGVELLSLSDFLQGKMYFSHLFTSTASIEPIFGKAFFEKLGNSKKLVFDFAEPPDVERFVLQPVRIIHMEDLMEEARTNSLERAESVAVAEKMIEEAMKLYCLDQKEKPILREFGSIEPEFQRELELALMVIEKEVPEEYQSKVKKIAEKLARKNLHLSREHLREILRRVSESQSDLIGTV
jgi:glutamyl-tRNA reductase